MKFTKRVEHRINMGSYESLAVSTEVTVDTQTDFKAVPTDEEILTYIDELVADSLARELDIARKLTTVDDSYIRLLEY